MANAANPVSKSGARSRDEIAMGITYKQAKKLTHTRMMIERPKEEVPHDKTKRRFECFSYLVESTTSEYTVELFVGGDVLRALTKSHACLSTVFTFLGITTFLGIMFAFEGGQFLWLCVAFLVD